MWKRALGYGVLLAVGAAALQGLTYQRLAHPWRVDGPVFLVAAAFLALGVWVGVQLWHRSPPGREAGANHTTPEEDQCAPDPGTPAGPLLPAAHPLPAQAPEQEARSAAGLAAAAASEPTPLLSARELTVLQQLAAGLSNKEIAQRLHLSPHTVKTHVAHVFEKLGARRRTEAIHKARELGIVR